ncbi:alpha-ketoglutarate-dependent dioxygenase AlkB [Pigmentiphaga kullae]|uniref:Alkylated DNA repair dioxygenase AlkB n=1 Tax=Pigmentiphaga kullae TaxID=151784 RepID=A0A4Q7NJS1_9BURK|nr:alpha-ketoglutarate-dependent dioxygenase AlkB [Pigmentiphaga kullae]RZS85325.1 alkylated DNA repair dioxygenase AlkB [Pigmentiphaga kullae]
MNTCTLDPMSTQSDLFERSARFSIDTSFGTARRFALDDHSWIEIVPGWMSGASLLYEQLRNGAPWREHERRMFNKVFLEPRMTASYRHLADVPQQDLLQAVRALSSHYGVAYDGLWMNLYRNGQDSTGWHRDHRSCRKLEYIVPVLTLGTTRRFLIRPNKGGSSMTFKPSSGDLVVMGGRSQQDWVHCVPKEPDIAGARISVNFMSSAQGVRDRA